jgi:short-subunit dehydrogenase
MVQVNILALTYLTYRALPGMLKNGCGAVLNISSSAGFIPTPNHSVYAASKAYVTSFSEALRAELRGSNITVTAVCPGPVPTEFDDVARRVDSGFISTRPEIFTVSAQEVVRQALAAVAADKARIIPGTLVNLAMTVVIFLPMFVKRIFLNVQARQMRTTIRAAAPDFETSDTL